MLKEAQPFLRLAPTDGIFPGAAMALALLACNLLEAGLPKPPRPQHRPQDVGETVKCSVATEYK